MLKAIDSIQPDAIVHTAAQPSHDRAAAIPFDDFDTNAVGTLNLLGGYSPARARGGVCPSFHQQGVRRPPQHAGARGEKDTRWDYADPAFSEGIAEDFPIDQSKHSLFGASKVAADIMVQEYGRYFDLKSCCLRGGCLTGPNHSGVELHGFLSYLVKCNLSGKNTRSLATRGSRCATIFTRWMSRGLLRRSSPNRAWRRSTISAGGKGNSCSILEAFALAEEVSGKPMVYDYSDEHRSGDHMCYYSDLRKMKAHYPEWDISKSLKDIFSEIHQSWVERQREAA